MLFEETFLGFFFFHQLEFFLFRLFVSLEVGSILFQRFDRQVSPILLTSRASDD